MKPVKPTQARNPWITASWVLAGTLAGAAYASTSAWPEFFRRLRLALGGARGDSSYWGEPLFYMAVMGAPAGFISGLITFALIVVIRRCTKSTGPPSQDTEG